MRKLAYLPLLFVIAACSGKVSIGANGSTQGSLKKNPDGTPTGNGQTCTYGGKTANVGDSFTAPDGCNTCKCAAEGAYCTEMACGIGCIGNVPGEICPDGGGGLSGTCNYDGKTFQKGDSWPCSDGCNTCSCMDDGQVGSTLMACNVKKDCTAPNACPDPSPGAPNYLCADGTTAGPVCADQGNGTCGWSFVECTCKANGKTYKAGDNFTTACNSCGCDTDGNVVCTEKACACPPSGTVYDCEPPVDNKPACAGPEHDWLVANCPGVSFAL